MTAPSDPPQSQSAKSNPGHLWQGPFALHPAERVEAYRARGWWTDDTIDALLRAQVARRGDALAVVDSPDKPALAGLPPQRWTWAQLDAEVDRIAAALVRAGVRPGEVVGVQLPNIAELVATFFAVVRIGAVLSPLPVQYREHEVRGMAGAARFAAFITAARVGDRTLAQSIRDLLPELPSVRTLLAFGDDLPSGVESLSTTAGETPTFPEYQVDPNHCVTICWTSGTESTPKAVPRSHYDWLAMARICAEAPDLTEHDVLLNPFPLVNMASIGGTLLPWLRTGGRYVLHHPFTLPTFLRQITEERVTYTLAPPAVLAMLLRNEQLLAQTDFSAMRAIGSGSAPLPPSMVRGWQEQHGIAIINFFGSNEGISLLSAPAEFPDPELRAQYFPRYGAPGMTWTSRAGEWTTVRLVDLATGADITEPGVPGELRINGPMVFAGYLPGTALTQPFDEQGFLRTGDVFQLAGPDNRFLHHVDRAKDLIIRGGVNIAPAEVEGLLASHPAVADVAVVGYPDPVLGEKVCAVVVPAPGSDRDALHEALLEHLRGQHIASFKLPERFEFVDALPRNPVGKVLKRELAARIAAPADTHTGPRWPENSKTPENTKT
jgi:acyl-CoA synthetase